MSEGNKNCLLCGAQAEKWTSTLWKCPRCELLFKNPESFLALKEETARYETHNNDVTDEGYLKYLHKLFSQVAFLKEGSVLDFGCGPSRGLEALVQKLNLKDLDVDSYDPIFFPELDQNKNYDLIYASECFEHFYKPQQTIVLLKSLLKSGGLLAVATNLYDGFTKDDLETWWYQKDPTHVIFYNQKTFKYISDAYQFEILHSKSPHIVLKSSLV